jgi:hypothetical protein
VSVQRIDLSWLGELERRARRDRCEWRDSVRPTVGEGVADPITV